MEKENQTVIPKKYPYVSFVTFKNALDALTIIGVPPTIDRSVLQQFSGANQGLLLQAFRYLGFTNQNDESTAVFHQYADADLDSEDQKGILGQLVKQCYPEQLKFLANGTIQNIKDTFNNTSVEASVKTKCLSFFLQTAKEAGLPISGHIIKGARGNRGPRGPRKEGSIKPKGSKNSAMPVNASGEGATSTDEFTLSEGMVRVRIAVGINKEWTILMPENYTMDELYRFIKVVQITLEKAK